MGKRCAVGILSPLNKILITGGFGFLGGRLAAHLAKKGHEIVIGSRSERSLPDWRGNIAVAKIDWKCNKSLQKVCRDVDLIIHAAGMNAQDCIEDPIGAIRVNGCQTGELVRIANQSGVKKFIYLSTAHVYAHPLVGEIDEDTSANNTHPYATSHLAGEFSVLAAHKRKEINGFVLRLANIFGYPMLAEANCWMLLVNDLCKQAVHNKNMFLLTNGKQQRNFLGAHRLCLLIDRILSEDCVFQGGVVNVGSAESITVLKMAQVIQHRCNEVLGWIPEININTLDAKSTDGDLVYRSKISELFGQEWNSYNDNKEIDALLMYCREKFSKF